jgi:hypothetical protein
MFPLVDENRHPEPNVLTDDGSIAGGLFVTHSLGCQRACPSKAQLRPQIIGPK